ncbi:histidine phosphatase family protein [SAR92 clade bacterium H455]|uniref:Histidine phosphatase family protein n=1 Tax=SAR92 clade bacterium H455 TaxID=2974818 RepID=A0ABY5TQL3_9GAMM|nr:histidine phosphatase family protein [SAR92 clade bacterium H455]
MNWYFLRHGQINSNLNKVYSGRSDEPLNAQGLQQAAQAAELISSKSIDRVISSPLARAGQTATIVAAAHNLKVSFDQAFNEMIFGPWEGLSEARVKQQYPLEWALWNSRPQDLRLRHRETLEQLQARVIAGMRHIEAEGRGDNILVVSHVAVIRVVALYAQGRPLSDYKSIEVDNCQLFPISISEEALQASRKQTLSLDVAR